MDKISPDMLSLHLFRSNPIQLTVQPITTSTRENPLGLCTGARHTGTSWPPCQRQGLLLLGSPPVQRVLVSFQRNIWWWFGYIWRIEKDTSERKRSGNLMLKCLLCLMSRFRFELFQQLRVLSLAERVAYLRYSINLRLFNWRVPGLVLTQKDINSTLFWETLCWITGGSKWDHLLQSWNFLPNKKHILLPHPPNPQICSEVRLKVGRYRDISQIGGISKSGSTI